MHLPDDLAGQTRRRRLVAQSTATRKTLYPDALKTREKFLAFRGFADSDGVMIRGGFLTGEDRSELIALARDGSSASRVTRRANSLVLLDDGWSCQDVADALLLNDDTIRSWHKLFEQRGIEGLISFDVGGSARFLSAAQEDALKVFVSTRLPRSTRQVGAWIEQEFGLVYESRSGLIALLHRLGLEYHKPNIIPRKLDEDKQKAFIESYDKLMNSLGNKSKPSTPPRRSHSWKRSKRSIRCWPSSMSFSTTRAIITPSWCRNGSRDPVAGSSCISFRAIARISIRSSGCGASCTETSRTTNATQLAPNSLMRRSVSCVKKFLGIGRISVIRSPTIFASSTQGNFGL